MTTSHAWEAYHGGARWEPRACPDCGAEDPAACCADDADRERYAERLADLRRAALAHARLRRHYDYTREEWLAGALRSGLDWARELPDRELAAIGEVTWGALGARGRL